MTTFDDRERHEETRFKHEQELAFKARNRGNRMFGLWIAEQLGLSGEAADDYAKDVVIADFEAPGDDDIFTKVKADLAAKSIELSDHVLHKRLQECRSSRPSRSRPNEVAVPADRARPPRREPRATRAGARGRPPAAAPERARRSRRCPRSAGPKGRSRPATAIGRRAAGAPTSEVVGARSDRRRPRAGRRRVRRPSRRSRPAPHAAGGSAALAGILCWSR